MSRRLMGIFGFFFLSVKKVCQRIKRGLPGTTNHRSISKEAIIPGRSRLFFVYVVIFVVRAISVRDERCRSYGNGVYYFHVREAQ